MHHMTLAYVTPDGPVRRNATGSDYVKLRALAVRLSREYGAATIEAERARPYERLTLEFEAGELVRQSG